MKKVEIISKKRTKLRWTVVIKSSSDPFCSRVWEDTSVVFGSEVCVAQHSLMRSRKKSAGSVSLTSTYTWTHFQQAIFFTLDITDMRQTKAVIWSIFSETCLWKLAYHVSEFNGGGSAVGFGVGWICVQHHLYLCIKVIHSHYRLAVREHTGAKVSLATECTS